MKKFYYYKYFKVSEIFGPVKYEELLTLPEQNQVQAALFAKEWIPLENIISQNKNTENDN